MHKIISKYFSFAIALAGSILLANALFFEKYFFDVKIFNIGNRKKLKGPVRIIHLTDLHLKNNVGIIYKKLARKINFLNPDFLFITGDSIDEHGVAETLDLFLSHIKFSLKKIAVLGNHEYASGENLNLIKDIYKKHNCDLMINESKILIIQNEKLVITGFDDLIKGKPNFLRAIKRIGFENNHLALIHTPLLYEKIKEEMSKFNSVSTQKEKINISYFLAGHTHGGQITFRGNAIVLPEKSGGYVAGWFSKERPYLYLSKGFGTSSVPFRWGARSEITLLNYYF